MEYLNGADSQKPEFKRFIFSFDNKAERLELPVPPSTFNLKEGQCNQVVNINDLGDINLIGKRRLVMMDFTMLLPARKYPFVIVQDLKKPDEYLAILRRWKESGKPCRLVVTGTAINHAFAIESYTNTTKDGTNDLYVTISLKEYRFLNVPASNNEAAIHSDTGLKERPTEKQVPAKIEIKKGKDMLDTAREVYGKGMEYRSILRNNDWISDIKSIKPGYILKGR